MKNPVRITHEDLQNPRVDEVLRRQTSAQRQFRVGRALRAATRSLAGRSWLWLGLIAFLAAAAAFGALRLARAASAPRDRVLDVGGARCLLSKHAQKYLRIWEHSDYESDRSVLIIEEPHYSAGGQISLRKGLEVFFADNPGVDRSTVFLAEGFPSGRPLSVDPLTRVAPNPSERLVDAVLRTYLITGYIAFEWQHQRGIPIIGTEDSLAYETCAELWVRLQDSGDNDTVRTAWVFSAENRNGAIARTLVHLSHSYQNPVLFVGGLHLHKQGVGGGLIPTGVTGVSELAAGEELGISDYLKRERIGYTFLVAVPGTRESPKEAEERRLQYTNLFRAQQTGDYSGYISSLRSRKRDSAAVTVTPSPEAAAQYIAATGETGSDDDKKKGEDDKGKDGTDKTGGSKDNKGGTGEVIPGSEEIHTDHPHGPYKDGHRHWRERHTDPQDPSKSRIERRTGPLKK